MLGYSNCGSGADAGSGTAARRRSLEISAEAHHRICRIDTRQLHFGNCDSRRCRSSSTPRPSLKSSIAVEQLTLINKELVDTQRQIKCLLKAFDHSEESTDHDAVLRCDAADPVPCRTWVPATLLSDATEEIQNQDLGALRCRARPSAPAIVAESHQKSSGL